LSTNNRTALRFIRPALMQMGALGYLVILMFHPSLFTAYNVDGYVLFAPFESMVLTMTFVLVTGMLCFMIASRCSTQAMVALALGQLALPLITGILIICVRWALMPTFTSILLGIAATIQIYLTARNYILGTSGTLLSASICLGIAVAIPQAVYIMTGTYVAEICALVAIMLISGCFVLMQARRRANDNTETAAEESVFTTVRQSLAFSHPVLPCILLSASNLGSLWDSEMVFGFRGQAGYFLVDGLLCVGFAVALYFIWKRSANASFLLLGSLLPIVINLIVAMFVERQSSSLLFVMGVFAQLCYFLLIWLGMQTLDKSAYNLGLVTTFYFLTFIVTFCLFSALSALMGLLVAMTVAPLLALAYLVYMVLHFARNSDTAILQGSDQTTTPDHSPLEPLLRSNCDSLGAEYSLSPREIELLPFFVVGMSSTAIGNRMFISPQTVKTHRYRIYKKFGIEDHEGLYDVFMQYSNGEQ
jgi:DNA-binding CsgD family transcriptional regulator